MNWIERKLNKFFTAINNKNFSIRYKEGFLWLPKKGKWLVYAKWCDMYYKGYWKFSYWIG